MKAVIEIRIEAEGGPYVQEVACVERAGHRLADLGLSLTESKSLLTAVQKILVEQQTTEYLEGRRKCPHCGAARAQKGSHTVNLQTLFGNLALDSPRWGHCPCQPHEEKTLAVDTSWGHAFPRSMVTGWSSHNGWVLCGLAQ